MYKKICQPKLYFWPAKPSQPEDMLEFKSNQGLKWGKSNLINFWFIKIASIETESTNDSKVR